MTKVRNMTREAIPAGKALDAFFSPKNVAVIGATEKVGSVGRTALLNLSQGAFANTVYPVNPKHTAVGGVRAFPNIGEVPAEVDLAIVVTPAATVPGLIGECADAGVKAAVVISAGFR